MSEVVKEHEAPLAERQEARGKIMALEDAILRFKQEELQVNHHFSKGIYAREMIIPKGTILTGKIHKHEHLNIMTKGKIRVVTEEGAKDVVAPAIIASPAGTKRAGVAIEDTIWITIHPTDERDLDKIEDQFIAQSFDEFDRLLEAKED